MRDRYVEQLQRQNEGLPCSDCGSHQGHFSFCPLLNKGLPVPQSYYRGKLSDLPGDTKVVFTGVKPDDWDTVNEWRGRLADAKQTFTEDDVAWLSEMRITLGEDE